MTAVEYEGPSTLLATGGNIVQVEQTFSTWEKQLMLEGIAANLCRQVFLSFVKTGKMRLKTVGRETKI